MGPEIINLGKWLVSWSMLAVVKGPTHTAWPKKSNFITASYGPRAFQPGQLEGRDCPHWWAHEGSSTGEQRSHGGTCPRLWDDRLPRQLSTVDKEILENIRCRLVPYIKKIKIYKCEILS